MIKFQEGKASGRYEDKTSLKNHQVRLNTLMQIVFLFSSVKIFNKPIVCSKNFGVA